MERLKQYKCYACTRTLLAGIFVPGSMVEISCRQCGKLNTFGYHLRIVEQLAPDGTGGFLTTLNQIDKIGNG